MNKAKKIIAALLCIIFCISLCPAVLAAESGPVITLSNKSVMPGDSVTIDVDISNNPGIMAMAFCITYDNDSFEFTKYTNGIISGPTYKNHEDKGHIAFVYVGNSDKTTNGTLLSVTFKVKDTAKAGKHTITLANSNRDKYGYQLHNSFSNSKQQFVVPTVKSGSITVGETCENSGHKYGEWTVTQEADCTKTGLKNHTCSRCQHFEEVEIPITHDFESDWTVDKAATPQEDGIMSRHCKKCDEVTDKITFSYEEIDGDDNGDTSSGEASGDVSDNSSENSSEGSNESTPSENDTSSNTVNNSSSQESNTTDNKKPAINNTEGAKNPLSAVEKLKDYQENIKPDIQNDDTSSDSQSSDASNESSVPEQNTDSSDTASVSDSNNVITQDENPSFFSTPTGIIVAILCALISAGILALGIILIIRNKKRENQE